MNFSILIGIGAAAVVIVFSILGTGSASEIFLDKHAIIIVIGGTLAASLLCFPVKTLLGMFKVILQRIFSPSSPKHADVIDEIVKLAQGQKDNPAFLEQSRSKIKNHFLKEAVDLLLEGTINSQKQDQILELRALTHFKRYDADASVFKVISRFPPAFGLMGTTLGMIALLRSLGSPEAIKLIGPAMAIGLVATFYGIAVANLILIPMGENLAKLNKEDEVSREIILHGIKLLRQKDHPIVVYETLKSYLLPSERNSKVSNKKAA